MWLDVIVSLSCSAGGFVCGWAAQLAHHDETARGRSSADSGSPQSLESENEATRERLAEVSERLRAYALSMAADVDAHQSRVQAVNDSLHENEDAVSPDAIFAAVNGMIEANEAMQRQLQSAQDQLQTQAIQIETAEQQAQTDALTRLANRRAFDEHFAKQHSLGAGEAGTVALLDVDHFKKFNDVYGHRAGDEVLRSVAGVLKSRLHPHGMVARYGGEEFAVVLDGLPASEASELVEAARVAIGERVIQFEGKQLRVTACSGLADMQPSETMESWLQRADDGLYRSKEAGRDCGHWMDGDVPVPITRSSPREAVTEQPVVSTDGSEPDSASDEVQPEPSSSKQDQEIVGEQEGDAEPSEQPRGGGYLRNRQALETSFNELRQRPGAADHPLFVMAVRFNGDPTSLNMRSILQLIRAGSRDVDRIGFENERTLIICVPNADASAVVERAHQICSAAKTMGLGANPSTPDDPISVGIAPVDTNDKFADITKRCVQAAWDAIGESGKPVRLIETAMA